MRLRLDPIERLLGVGERLFVLGYPLIGGNIQHHFIRP